MYYDCSTGLKIQLKYGRPQGIRTLTGWRLRPFPLPVGVEAYETRLICSVMTISPNGIGLLNES